jgi:hypothetical protein
VTVACRFPLISKKLRSTVQTLTSKFSYGSLTALTRIAWPLTMPSDPNVVVWRACFPPELPPAPLERSAVIVRTASVIIATIINRIASPRKRKTEQIVKLSSPVPEFSGTCVTVNVGVKISAASTARFAYEPIPYGRMFRSGLRASSRLPCLGDHSRSSSHLGADIHSRAASSAKDAHRSSFAAGQRLPDPIKRANADRWLFRIPLTGRSYSTSPSSHARVLAGV